LSGKNYPDGRKIVEILNLEDAQQKTESLKKGIKNWLAQIDKKATTYNSGSCVKQR
jgi:hypothetical protein